MANLKHLAKLKEGVESWNQWRKQYPRVQPDLSGADLVQAELSEFDFHDVDLSGANLLACSLRHSNLDDASLGEATLCAADLVFASLRRADLHVADLSKADLGHANLSGACLVEARMVNTQLNNANLTGCSVYGMSVWNVNLNQAIQTDLVITPQGESPIQVDDIEVAQFIYLLLSKEKLRAMIDTITSKVVLILGRFTPARKDVLDAIREELRKRGYVPILFDFEKPTSKDLTGTISTLANMARFIIADLSDPSSVPHELASIVPGTVVAVQPIILEGQREYAMFSDLMRRYPWVLKPYEYKSQKLLIANLNEAVLGPAEAKAKALARR